MREYGVHQLFLRRLEIHRNDVALDQLGHFGAHHVRTDERSGVLIEDHLDETLVLAERDRLAVADEREASDPDLELPLLGAGFGETDRGDLRRTIGAAGNELLVHGMRL